MLDSLVSALQKGELSLRFRDIWCGIGSALWFAAREADGGSPAYTQFPALLERLENATLQLGGDYKRDPSLAGRCSGLLNVLRALLGYSSKPEALKLAALAFEGAWRGPLPDLGEKPEQYLTGDELYEAYREHLDLKHLGGWLSYDALWHLRYSRPGKSANAGTGQLLAREAIPVLCASGSMYTGRVLHLVAELLPGPPGLVTPDWWPMGLIRFQLPTASETQSAEDRARSADFLEATQRVMVATAACLDLRYRLRWRLEYRTGKGNPWNSPLTGRSAEAAAAVVTRAVAETHSTKQQDLLDPEAAVTACVADVGDGFDFATARLGKVDDASLRVKLAAAREAKYTAVFVAEEQGPQPLAAQAQPFPGLFLDTRATLEDAYQDLLYQNRYVKAHHDHLIRDWNQRWSTQETPRESPPVQT